MDVKPCDFDGVCGVLEMFGFFIGKTFYPREVGMSSRNGTSSHQKYVIPGATGCTFHRGQLRCAKAECDGLWQWMEDAMLNAQNENRHTELLECPEFD